MSSNGINMLNSTVNGLNSLDLDELSANRFSTGTMNGDLTYIRRVEANEVIIDTRLTLTNTGVISVGAVTLSDVELTYLDGVTSNIQAQLNAAANTSGLQSQITALQVSDASQNLSINALQVSDMSQFSRLNNIDVLNDTQNSRLSSVESVNASQSTAITSLQTSDNSQNIRLNNIESLNTTQNSRLTAVESVNTTQNSRLTAVESVNTTQNSSITALQTSDASQNNSIASLNFAVTGQITSITNLQLSDTTQNTRLNNIESVNTSQDSSIATVLNRVRNMTATSALTSMSKPLVFNENGEVLKFSGNQAFLASYDSADGTRNWTFGGQSSTTKNVIWNNDKNGSTTIVTGTNASNLRGRNNLNIHSNGILLNRGWVDAGNTSEYSGGIGQLNPNLNTFFVAGNGTNSIYIDPGLGSITLNSNTVWMSGQVAGGNGRFSNLNFINSSNSGWETQSDAFLPSHKQQITTNQTNIATLTTNNSVNTAAIASHTTSIATINSKFSQAYGFGGSKGKIKFDANFDILGSAVGTMFLANNTAYGPSFFYLNVGVYVRNAGYTSLFDASGKCISTETIMNCNMSFEMEFLCMNTALSRLRSKIIIRNDEFVEIEQTQFQGVQFRVPLAQNENIMYNVGSLKHLLDYGHYIYLLTEYDFTTQSEGTLTRMNGRFTIDRNVF